MEGSVAAECDGRMESKLKKRMNSVMERHLIT